MANSGPRSFFRPPRLHIIIIIIIQISHFQGTNEEILSHFLFLIILYHKNFFKSTFCRNMSFFRIFDDFQRFLAIFAPFLAIFDQFLMILSHFCSFLRILGRDFSPFTAIFSKNFQKFFGISPFIWSLLVLQSDLFPATGSKSNCGANIINFSSGDRY